MLEFLDAHGWVEGLVSPGLILLVLGSTDRCGVVVLSRAGRVATRVSWSPLSGLKGVQPPLPFAEGPEASPASWRPDLRPGSH